MVVQDIVKKMTAGKSISNQNELLLITQEGLSLAAEVNMKMASSEGEMEIMGWVRDISGRENFQDSIREREERYRSLFELSPVGLIIWKDEKITMVNRAAMKLFGAEKIDELIGKSIWDVSHPDYHDELKARLAQVREKGLTPNILEYDFKKIDGNIVRVESAGAAITLYGRQVFLAVYRDVTESREASEAIRENEEWLRAIFEATPNPIVVYDRVGHPLYLNPAFSKVFGWSLEELEGRRIPFVPDEEKELTASKMQKLFESGKTIRFESKRQTKYGKILDMFIGASPIKDSQGSPAGMVVNLTDITERIKLEKQFYAAQRMESLGTLAGGIAHDFNNLLMGIQGNIGLLLFEKDPKSKDYEKLRNIENYIKKGSKLTSQLLGLARGGKYEVKPTDLNELIKSQNIMFGYARKEINIHPKYQNEIWPVDADQVQIDQVILNIYLNAWQAMPKGGDIFVETKNTVIYKDYNAPYHVEPGKYVKVSVTDTGIGMDKETLQKIFEPFFTTKGMGKGTGLGLASVYGIVKNHGGFINAYSEVGNGSTFNIYLPASEDAITEEITTSGEFNIGNETVLLVDDEEMITEVGGQILEKLGYRVLTASSGKEAIQTYEDYKDGIQLVILDMIMPEMGGGDTFNRLKELDNGVKVLLSSGYSINGQASEILKRGCQGFIQKPFNIKELSAKIREILDKEQVKVYS
jgi:PAS domain S-box-containing protein